MADEYSDELLGLGVKELTQDYIINNDLDFDTEGVWVSRVEEGGSASIAGIDVNDLIISINNKPIQDLGDFKTVSSKIDDVKPEYIQVFLKRQGKTQFVYIKTMLDGKK